jgi:hypothetical protein
MGQKHYASVQRVFWIAVIGIMFILEMGCANMQQKPSERSPVEAETTWRENQLSRARQLLSEVEHSPSANLEELRNKLREAQGKTASVLEVNPNDAEARELAGRIEQLLSKLSFRPHDDHPWVAEAEATLNRLAALIKGNGPRSEVEALHTHLCRLAKRIEKYKPVEAARFQQKAEELWELYTSNLKKTGQDCSKLDFLGPSCAEELIMDLPEVKSLAEQISKHKEVRPIIIVEDEPNPNAKPGTEEAAFRVYFGEDHGTHTVRVLTFSVDARTRNIFVYNDALSERIPYEEWKKKKK